MSAADREHLDPGPFGCRVAADFRVAIVPDAPYLRNGDPQLVVGRAVPQPVAQVVAVPGEEARVELAVRGQPGPRAIATERLCHRCDDADLAAAVAVAPAVRDFAAVVRGVDLER